MHFEIPPGEKAEPEIVLCLYVTATSSGSLESTQGMLTKKGSSTRTLKSLTWRNKQSADSTSTNTSQALKNWGRIFSERHSTIRNWTGIPSSFLLGQLLLTLPWHLSGALPFGNDRTMCAILKYLGFVSFCSYGEDLLKIPGLQNSSNNSKTKYWKYIFSNACSNKNRTLSISGIQCPVA